MEEFKTINKNAEAEIIEKKSKFIAHVFYVETPEEADKYIKEIKKKYHDARHNVFAYAIETGDGGIAVKYNDDGEPRGDSRSTNFKDYTRTRFIQYFSSSYKIFWRNTIRNRGACSCVFR